MKISIRTISFAAIIVICIVAVIMAFYMQFGGSLFKGKDTTIDPPILMTEENKRIG